MASPATKPPTPLATEPATVLERLLRDRAGLAHSLAALQASSARLRETGAAEAAVLAEINAPAAADVASMTAWASAGCHGDAPRSDQQKRIVLGQRLNAAQAAATAAKAAGQDIDRKIADLGEQLATINDQAEQTVFDQIEREHGDVISEFVGVCERGSALATRRCDGLLLPSIRVARAALRILAIPLG